MNRILIVEDEAGIAGFVEKGLRRNGFSTQTATNGHDAVELAGGVDLIILDLGLPGLDGFSVLRRIRDRRNAVPVIVLTARDEVRDTVAALEGGANDYMTKPFAFEELLARVRLRLHDTGTAEPQVLRSGTLSLDLRTRRAVVDGTAVELSAREFTLAEIFLRHPDQVLTREQLLDRVWGFDFDPGSNVVDVYVRYLRRKLGDDVIETVRGTGYRLRAGSA